jgi:hypothetical protein
MSAEILATEAARRRGLTTQAIGQWANRAGAPVRKEGRRVFVAWPDFARWREQQMIATAMPADGDAVRTRKLQAEARLAELTLAEREGQLAPVADMDAAVEQLAGAVRDEVRGLRARFAARMVGLETVAEAARELDAMAVQILASLVTKAESLQGDDAPAAVPLGADTPALAGVSTPRRPKATR